jgi:hypothetical protein
MPRIPQLNTQSISTNAVDLGQGPSVTRAGVASGALGQIGDQLMNLGSNLMAKRKQAETSTFVNTKKNELNRMIAQKETELDAKYTGDPTGYSAEMGDFLKGYYEEQKDLAPNDEAKLMFDNEFNSFSTQVGLNAQAKENKRKAEYQSGLITEDAFKNRQVLAQKPDTILATDFLNNSLKSVNDGIGLYYNETQAKELKRKIGTDYAGTLLEGFESNKRYSEGLRFLNGKDADGAIMLGYTDPKQIQAYKERFTRLAEQEVELSKRVFNTSVNDLSTALMQGLEVKQEVFNSVANQAQFLKPEERALVLDNLNNAKQYNQMLNDLKTMPIDKIREKAVFEIPRAEGDIFNLTARQNMALMYKNAATDMLNKKLTDGASFAIKADSTIENLSEQAKDINDIDSMKEYSTKVIQRQKMDGISNIKVLDDSLANTYGAMLKSKNTEASFTAFNNLKQGYGDNFGLVVSDLISKKQIEPERAMAMYLSDPNSIKKSFSNIDKAKEIKIEFDKKGSDSDLNKIYEDDSISDFKRSLAVNDPYQNNLWIGNGVDNLIKLEYQSGIVDGLSHKEAKSRAIENILTKNIQIAKSKNSQVILTKDHIPYKSRIEDFMSDYLNKQNIHKQEFKISDTYKEKVRMADIDDVTGYFNNDLSKNGVWITNDSQSGATLRLKTSDGYAPILDKQGKPVEIKFNDMIKSVTNKPVSYKEGF